MGRKVRYTVMGTKDYLDKLEKSGIKYDRDTVWNDFITPRNRLSNRLSRMHKNNRLNGSIQSGAIGAGVGLLGSQFTLLNLKDKLRRRYPEKSKDEIDKLARKITMRNNAVGAVVGSGLGIGLQVLANNNRYNKARKRLSDMTDKIYLHNYDS